MSTRSERLRRRSHQARVGASALLAACLAPPFSAQPAVIAQRVLEELQEARRRADLPELATRSDLERAARERARCLAALPHSERLATPIEAGLRESGVDGYRRAAVHVDLNRGYDDPARAFAEGWRRYAPGWKKVLDPAYDAIGLATARGDDGFVVLVAILIETGPPRPLPPRSLNPRELERAALRELERARRSDGLAVLVVDERLNAVARFHSADMARGGFFDHTSPSGIAYAERLRRAGVSFDKSAENLHRNRNAADPVRAAVDGWLASARHRANLLDADFRRTGLGVAVDDEGTVYFTQLFVAP